METLIKNCFFFGEGSIHVNSLKQSELESEHVLEHTLEHFPPSDLARRSGEPPGEPTGWTGPSHLDAWPQQVTTLRLNGFNEMQHIDILCIYIVYYKTKCLNKMIKQHDEDMNKCVLCCFYFLSLFGGFAKNL